eukprot:4013289-Karenia_brevis.AAC.1
MGLANNGNVTIKKADPGMESVPFQTWWDQMAKTRRASGWRKLLVEKFPKLSDDVDKAEDDDLGKIISFHF